MIRAGTETVCPACALMVIELTEDAALVLFDVLARAKSVDAQRSLVLEHPVERNALWVLEAELEKAGCSVSS